MGRTPPFRKRRRARGGGFVTYELQGRLLQAQLALARGRKGEARKLAADLATEACAKASGSSRNGALS